MTKRTGIHCGLIPFSLWALQTLSAGTAPPPVPSSYQDLYNLLNAGLASFNTTIDAGWNGSKSPVLFAGNLTTADANMGPQLVIPQYYQGVLLQLNALQAVGAQAVMIQISFPMLYQPFYQTQSDYQQYLNFYTQVASDVRLRGMKLIVETTCLLWPSTWDTWNLGTFYSTLSWNQYQNGRMQTAQAIVGAMHPDYLVVIEEPDTEAAQSGQSQANTVSGSTGMLNLILSGVQQMGVTGMQVGAGVGTWHPQYQLFVQSFLTTPVDSIDMHIYPVNKKYLPQALTIAQMASAAGKTASMTEAWLYKIRDTELGTLNHTQVQGRDPFSFWAPLDAYFLQTLVNFSYYQHLAFVAPYDSQYYFGYLPYNTSTQSLTPGQIITQEGAQSAQNIQQALYSTTGQSYHDAIVTPPDITPPASPTNLTAVSGSPTTTYLTWNPSSDNVGVAGYCVLRNGVCVGTTAQAFFQDSGLTGATAYSYAVEAFDLAANISAPSSPVNVTTR